MFKIGRVVLLVALALAFASIASASEASNRKIQDGIFNDRETLSNQTVVASDSRVLRIDATFASRFGYRVPIPFALTLPQTSDVIINVQLPDQVDHVYARISFSGFATGEFETLDVTPLRVELTSTARRRQIMSRFIITRVFPSLTARYMDKRRDRVSFYAFPGADSVVLNGSYRDPNAGEISLRIYAVMPKNKTDGLLFYERVVEERAENAERYAEDVVRSVVFD